jgi:hypothetical protein
VVIGVKNNKNKNNKNKKSKQDKSKQDKTKQKKKKKKKIWKVVDPFSRGDALQQNPSCNCDQRT